MGSAWSRKQAAIDASFEAAPRDVSSWDLQHVKILHQHFRVRMRSEPDFTVLSDCIYWSPAVDTVARQQIITDKFVLVSTPVGWVGVSRRRVPLQDGGGDYVRSGVSFCFISWPRFLPVWVFRVRLVWWVV